MMTPKKAEQFIIEVKTDNSGTSGSTQFTIPTFGIGYNYDVETSEQSLNGQTGNATLTWSIPGTYEVKIKGDFPRIYFNNTGDRLKILKVKDWGSNQWLSFERAFYGCSNLDIIAADTPNLTSTTSLGLCFFSCSSLVNSNGSISNWNVSNVTNMNSTFRSCTLFNQPIGNWDTSSVTTFASMFQNAISFNQPIENWDTSSIIGTGYLQMFLNATSFNQPIGNWNTSSATTFAGMFSGASSFNNGGSSNINNWDTSSITGFAQMFQNATSFNQPIGNWNTSSATTFASMFRLASSFNQPIGNWDTSSVIRMDFMFLDAVSFNQKLDEWSLSPSLTDLSGIFSSSGMSTENYTDTVVGWANYVNNNAKTPASVNMANQTGRTFQNSRSGGSGFADAAAARTFLITATPTGAGWTISGDTIIA
jgi:surface protein